MWIKSKNNIFDLTGICADGQMLTSLLALHCQDNDNRGISRITASSLSFDVANVSRIINEASKTCLHFEIMAYQEMNPIIRQERVPQKWKHASVRNIQRCLQANVIIDKNVALQYYIPHKNRRTPNKVIRAPPSCHA